MRIEASGLGSTMAQMRKAGELCDVTLIAMDGSQFPCHRFILAASAGYFRALFTGAGSAMREGSSSSVRLWELGPQELADAIDCMYELMVTVSHGNQQRAHGRIGGDSR